MFRLRTSSRKPGVLSDGVMAADSQRTRPDRRISAVPEGGTTMDTTDLLTKFARIGARVKVKPSPWVAPWLLRFSFQPSSRGESSVSG